MTRSWRAAAAAIAIATACRGDAESITRTEPMRSEPAAPSDPQSGECRDWSTLDVTTLPALPESAWAPVLDDVWRLVLQKHFDPTIACLDWPALRMQYAERLVGVKDRRKAYAIIDEMLHKLGQSHFRLFGGEPHTIPPLRPAVPPIEVRWIEEALVVVDGDRDGVPAGAKLLAIDDVPTASIIADVGARAQRPSELSFELSRAATAYLSCDRAGQKRRIRATDPHADDAEIERTLTCRMPEGELVTLGNLRDIPTRVEHRMIEGTSIGYLAFNVWMLPMVERVKAAMADLRAQGMTALVLDLRGNPGGVGPMSVPVARMLSSEPGSLGALRFRDFTQEFNVEPGDDPFTGPVAVLIDASTASTSEIFVQGMRDLGRVTVVGGETSAGAALPSLIEELSGGAVLQYVVGEYRSPKGVAVEGKGVVPDVQVIERRTDFAAGKDAVLAAAIETLESHDGTRSG